MNPLILALSTAVPPHIYLQEDAAKMAVAISGLEKEKAELTNRIYLNSAIEKRHIPICFGSPFTPNSTAGMDCRSRFWAWIIGRRNSNA